MIPTALRQSCLLLPILASVALAPSKVCAEDAWPASTVKIVVPYLAGERAKWSAAIKHANIPQVE